MYQDELVALGVTASKIRDRFENDDDFFWILSIGATIDGNPDCCAVTASNFLLNEIDNPNNDEKDDLTSMKFVTAEFASFEIHHDYDDAFHFLHDAWTAKIDPRTMHWANEADMYYIEGEGGEASKAFKRLHRIEKTLFPHVGDKRSSESDRDESEDEAETKRAKN